MHYLKKARKRAGSLVETGATLSVGSSVIGSMGGSVGGNQGLSAFGSMMTPIGSVAGGATVLEGLKEIKYKRKRRRR